MSSAEPDAGLGLGASATTLLLALGLSLCVGCDPGRESDDPGRRPTASARAGVEPALDPAAALRERADRRADSRESRAPDSRPPLDLHLEARSGRHPERSGGPSQRYVFRNPAADVPGPPASGSGSGGMHPDTASTAAEQPSNLASADVETRDYLGLLESSDPVLRAEAARNIEPQGMGLQALLVVLEEDPDPLVRVAAVAQLEDADDPAGVRGLVAALGDGDRRVVLEAVDALEFAADEWVIPDLRPLLDHPDEEVRSAAEEAIAFLQ